MADKSPRIEIKLDGNKKRFINGLVRQFAQKLSEKASEDVLPSIKQNRIITISDIFYYDLFKGLNLVFGESPQLRLIKKEIFRKFASDATVFKTLPLDIATRKADGLQKLLIDRVLKQLNKEKEFEEDKRAKENARTRAKAAQRVNKGSGGIATAAGSQTSSNSPKTGGGQQSQNALDEVAKIQSEEESNSETYSDNSQNQEPSNHQNFNIADNSTNIKGSGDQNNEDLIPENNIRSTTTPPRPKTREEEIEDELQELKKRVEDQKQNQLPTENQNSSPLNQIAQNQSQELQNPETRTTDTSTLPQNTNFKQPDKIPTSNQAPGNNAITPPGSNTTTPDPKSKQNTKPGNGNLKPGTGANTKPGDTTSTAPNTTPPPNPNLDRYKSRGAGRIGGAVSGFNTGKYAKTVRQDPIAGIQEAAGTGFKRSVNIQNQAMEDIQDGKVGEGEKKLAVAESIARKARRLAANSRFRLAFDAFKKQIIKLAIPIIINALIAALFIGGFVVFTVAVLCALARTPIIQHFLPSQLKGFCGGQTDNGGADCPAGYTAWVQDPSGKWVQTANPTTGTTGNVTAGIEGIPKLPYNTSCPRINAFLRAIIFKESVLTTNPLVPGPEGVFYWRFPSTPFAKQTPQPHPDISAPGPSGSSNAAGAFQFLSDSYYKRIIEIPELMNPLSQSCKDLVRAASSASASKEQVRRAGVECVDFSPTNQTRAAFQYLKILGALDTLCSGNGSDDSVKQAIRQTSSTWASLPGGPQAASGYSADDFVSIYRRLLKEETGNERASNDSQSALATVTNNLKQFFQPIRAEANAADQEIRDRVAGYFDKGEFFQVEPQRSTRDGIKNGNFDMNIVKFLDNLHRSGLAIVTGPVDWGRSGGDHVNPSRAIDIWGVGRLSDIQGKEKIKGLKTSPNDNPFFEVAGGDADTPAPNGNTLDTRIRRHVDVPVDPTAMSLYESVYDIAFSSGVGSQFIGHKDFIKHLRDKGKSFVSQGGASIQDDLEVYGSYNRAHYHHFHIGLFSSATKPYKYSEGIVSPGSSAITSGGAVICCPPGISPGNTSTTSPANTDTVSTLGPAKDSGNEFSQLTKGHLEFMEWVAKERGYTGPFADNGGPDPVAKTAADRLIAKARSEGIRLLVAGEAGNYGYRGYNTQTDIFLSQIPSSSRYQDSMGTPDKVPQNVKTAYLDRAKSSAPVGYSEHHTGKGMDFIVEGMTQADLSDSYDKNVASWLATNAPKEGFRLSYPVGSTKGAGYEPWHWFYTGQKTSNVEVKSNNFDLSQLFTPIKAEAQSITTQDGTASFYGGPTDTYWQGRATASGEIFDENKLTAASNTLPLGTFVRVTNKANGKNVVVKINDTGGFTELGRIIDVSYAAAKELDMINSGIVSVKVEVIDPSRAGNTNTNTTSNTPAACVRAGSNNSNSGTTSTKPGNLASNGGQTLNTGTYDADFLKKLADGILPIFSSERDCYRVVAGSGSVLERLDPDMIFKGLVPSGKVNQAYQFHEFMQQSPEGIPNYVRYGYEFSTNTANLRRGSLVVLGKEINGDAGDVNVFIGREEMTRLGRSGDGWMGRPVDNQSLASAIDGVYTKIRK